MARALSIQRSIIPAVDRDRHLERLRARRDHYQRANCRFWVFEQASLAGAFLEFIEASDAATLAAAHAAAPESPLDADRIYVEVELT
ncbi:MAG TPA: hypothetical protein VJL28_00430 [Gemmatimonadaceae bacterium]|nr:hypothetical protein [Gemmatimonadaceae bacterium]